MADELDLLAMRQGVHAPTIVLRRLVESIGGAPVRPQLPLD
jgi:hypothetical protein